MYPNDSYIKPTPIVSSTHNFLLCMLPVPKRSCNTELMCMSEFKKCSIQVMFCTLLPLDSSYNGMVIESIWINSWEGNSQSCKISQPSPLNQILYFYRIIQLSEMALWMDSHLTKFALCDHKGPITFIPLLLLLLLLIYKGSFIIFYNCHLF